MGSTTAGEMATSLAITELVDQLAENHPNLLYCVHPESQDGDIFWREVTITMLARAINRLAWWIEDKLKHARGQVLAYMGSNDLRYAAFILACVKTGNRALLLSTRNSLPASKHLLQATHCSVLVDGCERRQLQHKLDQLEDECQDLPLQRWRIDPLWEVFSPAIVTPYISTQPRDLINTPVLMFHTSGTTNHPKPISMTHGYLWTLANMQKLPVPAGRQPGHLILSHQGQLRFMYGPLFHFLGVVCMMESLLYGTPFLLIPDRPLTPELFAAVMARDQPPRWGLIAPFILEGLCASEAGRTALAKLKGLNYGGAPLNRASGDTLAAMIPLVQLMGSTETGYTPTLRCEDPRDWEYMEWHPAFALRMDAVGDDLWELVHIRPESKADALCAHHAIFHSYPHLNEFRTGDLFRPHPDKARLWRYQGRGDDIVVLSNGEKFNPVHAEKEIQSHPLVAQAVICGQDRFQAALLIEPDWNQLPADWTPEWLLQTVWPTVDKANASLPAHGQVFRSHIGFALRDKPFELSPKGSLRRRQTLKSYQTLVDRLYAQEPEKSVPDTAATARLPEAADLETVQRWVRQQTATILAMDIINEDDLVALGLDSLQAVRLAQVLQDASHQTSASWTSSEIYKLATISAISNTLHQQIHRLDSPGDTSWPRATLLGKLIWEQAQMLGDGGLVVALTGSTGELGSHLLHQLLHNPAVSHVYCLNRTADARQRQVASFREKGLPQNWLSDASRVQFYQVKLDQDHLGLSNVQYEYLRQNVHLVIHNAWLVNFNAPVHRFASCIAGVRRLLSMIENSPRQAEFHFISSISTVTGPSLADHPFVPETLHTVSSVMPQGYAESKYIAEALCGIAAQRCGTRVAIHRVGQLGGPAAPDGGAWNPRDWFPALVCSSRTLRQVPDSLGFLQVDWLPIDTAAQIIADVIQTRVADPRPGLTVYHVVNPLPVDWRILSGVVAGACQAKVVSLDDWIRSISQRITSLDIDVDDVPAAQLLDFFRGLAARRGEQRPQIASEDCLSMNIWTPLFSPSSSNRDLRPA
ncbi:hypothetical protein ASPZODRAFT_16084 [Penicilliopsis zonata CBS 506.65]|uniref:Carrier domain-containing protein n=1 Tax=Penicilliopsis zonata CBS 506.65 TaxID=1073090 RepID=A0A1L9SJX4_9EURO|nr:hypothetical protein ASPZODRAFT_16084 [Penicilliopsis zonata CBS 506.65]OJJ47403.1 hypothetical protein ASPZODRAFT_16084 [Penicilliopsis zonata CBS 506.65]